jgi:putative hemolysin
MSLFTAGLLALFILVFLSALFSATETAYTGLSFHQLRRTQKIYPNALSLWEKETHRVLATLLLSNNAVNSAAGVLAAALAGIVSERVGWRVSILSILFGLVVSSVVLVFGEIIPKLLAQRFALTWALLITPFMRPWTRVVSPFAGLASSLGNALLLRFVRRRPPTPFLNKAGLRRILLHARLPSTSHRLINNVMEFGRLRAGDVAQPRSEIVAVSLNWSLERVVQTVIHSGYSRVPICRSGMDDVAGMILAKDLLVAWRSGALLVIEDLVRPILNVSPDSPLPDVLRLFRSRRQHLAVLRNSSNGRVQGLITLQNALAALVGDIKEED